MTLSERELSPYENLQLNMLLAYGVDVFDMMSDSMYGDYEVSGNDKDGRYITIKVSIDRGDEE